MYVTNFNFQGAIYGMSQSIPDRSMVSQIVGLFLEACYSTKDAEPEMNGSKNGKHSKHGKHNGKHH